MVKKFTPHLPIKRVQEYPTKLNQLVSKFALPIHSYFEKAFLHGMIMSFTSFDLILWKLKLYFNNSQKIDDKATLKASLEAIEKRLMLSAIILP